MDRLEICMTVFLGINTWTDIRKKEICVPVLSVFLAGGILWRIWEGTFWADGLISMGAGTIAAVISVLTRGGNRIWRRTSDSGNGICTEKWRITGSTLRCAFAVWNLFRPAASGV